MADKMTTCKSCNVPIAKSAKHCPSCGAKNKKPVYLRWWFIVIAIIVAIGVISSLGGEDSDTAAGTGSTTTTLAAGVDTSSAEAGAASTEPAKTEAVETTTEAPKSATVVSAEELVNALENNALKAANTYKGEYVEITGKLANIDSSGKYFTIDPITSDYNFTFIMCYIKSEHLEVVSDLDKGQEVTVIGTIKDVGEVMGYSVDVESIR